MIHSFSKSKRYFQSWAGLWSILLLTWGGILTQVPLLNLLSFEFAFACCLPISFLGAHSGFRASQSTTSSSSSLVSIWLNAFKASIGLALTPLIPILLNAFWVRNCNWLDGLLFYTLLPLGSLIIAQGYGLLIYRLAHPVSQSSLPKQALSESKALFYFTGIFLATLLWGILAFISSPAVDVFSVFMGYYPGAIYDEELFIGLRLALSRLEDLGVVIVLLGLSSHPIAAHLKSQQATNTFTKSKNCIHKLRSQKISVIILICIHIWAWVEDLHRPSFWVQSRLGGQQKSQHFTMYYPKTWSEQKVQDLLTELEFNYQELSLFFGQAPTQTFTAYFYQSPLHKKRLMGAGHTLIAKPWHRSIHIHAPYVGDRVITHELAHAFSADIAPQPHRLSMHYGMIPHMSLIEGLAVAATWTRGRGSGLLSRLSPHQWTAALRRLGIAPPIKELLQPSSFYGYNSSLAYTMCGSFVRFFKDEQGQDALNRFYASGGQDLGNLNLNIDTLIEQWNTWLDRLVLDDLIMNTAEALLKHPSIFSKVCAHDLAARRSQAYELEAQEKYVEAFELWHSIDQDSPGDQTALLKKIRLAHLQKDENLALELVKEALNKDALSQKEEQNATLSYMVNLRLQEWLIDLSVYNDEQDLFQEDDPKFLNQQYKAYTALMDQSLNRPLWRRLAIKRYAHAQQTPMHLRQLIMNQLWSPSTDQKQTHMLLTQALKQSPSSAELNYLVARSYFNQEDFSLAQKHFEKALNLKLSHHSLRYESLKLIALGLFYSGSYQKAQLAFESLRKQSQLHILEGEEYSLSLWAKRAQFFAQTNSL